MALLTVENLSVYVKQTGRNVKIVREMSFVACSGQRLAIVGESGSGKSMTALAILGLLPQGCYAAGQVLFAGKNLLKMTETEMNKLRGRELVLIPQSGSDFMNSSLTVGSHFRETLRRLGVYRKENIMARSCELLSAVGFSEPWEILKKYPFQLSGGMAQRVVMAIGMAGEAHLVIADEPTRGVDDETAATFMDGIKDSFTDAAIIIITHNISVAKACERLLVMRGGEILEYGDTCEILANPTHPYTRDLIDALPENGLKVTGHPCDWEVHYD